MKKSYCQLLDKFSNDTCFIVASGTSVNDCYNISIFKEIEKHTVIVVNSSILLFDWKDGDSSNRIWTSNDSAVMNWTYWKDVQESKSIKLLKTSCWDKYSNILPDDYFYFDPRKDSYEIDEKDIGLCRYSSVPSAIDFAIQANFKKIFILGLDHYFINSPNNPFLKISHFWQLWPKDKMPRTNKIAAPLNNQEKIFDINKNAFNGLKIFANNKNVEIYNCNLKSKIECFNKISFEDSYSIWK